MHNVPKWLDTLQKSYRFCCKIFKVYLTILGHYAFWDIIQRGEWSLKSAGRISVSFIKYWKQKWKYKCNQ